MVTEFDVDSMNQQGHFAIPSTLTKHKLPNFVHGARKNLDQLTLCRNGKVKFH